MTKKRPTSTDPTLFYQENPTFFFKQWRKYRGMNQEPLAAMVGTTPSTISQVENGVHGFRSETLVAWAKALKCHPGELLMRDPTATDDLWSVWEGSPQLQALLVRLASLSIEKRLQIIAYTEGAIDTYERIRETAITPNL